MADIETLDVQEDAAEETSFLDKDPAPCKNFRIDTTKTFGHCKCGWMKADHEEKEMNKAAQALQNLRQKSSKWEPVDNVNGAGPCLNYRVDTAAEEFGTCKCGYKQADHKEKLENKASMALKSLKSKNASRNSRIKGSKACDNYRVDTAAENFGDCLCGFPKGAHVEKGENAGARALRLLKEKNEAKNRQADLKAQGIALEEAAAAKSKASAPTSATETHTAQEKSPGCCVIS
mmetsp:Transcript_7352/g.9321  ORF Transcript_7352/g.9321 Transcript_7352/m.9321 type:complete len:233 (-) Transcript_7352:624-1322(-)